MEAEEIVKQLDMEQVDEIITSTAASANGASYTSQAVQIRSINNGLEEVEDVTDRDLPPLTGKGYWCVGVHDLHSGGRPCALQLKGTGCFRCLGPLPVHTVARQSLWWILH